MALWGGKTATRAAPPVRKVVIPKPPAPIPKGTPYGGIPQKTPYGDVPGGTIQKPFTVDQPPQFPAGQGAQDTGADPYQQALRAQLQGMQTGQFGTAENRVRQDLASQLAQLGQSAQWMEADVAEKGRLLGEHLAQQTGRIKEALPGQLGDIGNQWAARGAFHSSGREGMQTEATKQNQQQISDITQQEAETRHELEQGRERERMQNETKRLALLQGSQRELEDLAGQRQEMELRQREQAANDAASARKAAKEQADQSTKEATAWTRARANQLQQTTGMSQQAAQERAIMEARSNWSGADQTFVEGVFNPPEKPKEHYAPGFSQVISGSRGVATPQAKQAEIRKGKWWNSDPGKGVRTFLTGYVQGKKPRTPEAVLTAMVDARVQMGAKRSEVVQQLQDYAPQLSLMMSEYGIA